MSVLSPSILDSFLTQLIGKNRLFMHLSHYYTVKPTSCLIWESKSVNFDMDYTYFKKKSNLLRGAPNRTVSKALSCNFCTWLRSRIFRIESVRVVFFTASLSRHSWFERKKKEKVTSINMVEFHLIRYKIRYESVSILSFHSYWIPYLGITLPLKFILRNASVYCGSST